MLRSAWNRRIRGLFFPGELRDEDIKILVIFPSQIESLNSLTERSRQEKLKYAKLLMKNTRS